MTRYTVIFIGVFLTLASYAQGDQQVRARADGLFQEKNYIEALPLYSQLVSNSPGDRFLNYRFGTCLLFGGDDKGKAIGHLKFAVEDPSIPPEAWFWLGRAYHLNYLFKEARNAYQRYQGTASKKELETSPVRAFDDQSRNGTQLLNNLKAITVRNKVEVDDEEFFRFYDLDDIGGKIVVLPEELKSSYDKKTKERFLVYLPNKGGPIYFSSYGKDGKTGRDIYRTELISGGTFSTPVKLAGYVNTDQDEDFAVLHSDGKNFYFSSKGHNSMGGYDIFRSSYDKGLDTFGPPENLDFAVNTPDDDLFYMVDPENKEACFASGRDSEQGKLHVYRVGTAQVPLVVTVLKGTYASEFNSDDRRAHIMVEDAVTRERVADVRTDMNGSYVLALPRSGEFRFLVECGPTGRTHQGLVEIPRSSGPRAFRQELELKKQGDLEKLLIRNYFDTPLEEDMIALMMEEIKRRARLDITQDAPVAQVPLQKEEIATDPLTAAGFSGDITEEKAVELAKEEAHTWEQLAADMEVRSNEAYGIAVEAVAEAERIGRVAERTAQEAGQEVDESAQKTKFTEAARQRQRSKEATDRARAALRTGQSLDAEAMQAQQRAVRSDKLATDLQGAFTSAKGPETLTHLTTLKKDLDERSAAQSGASAGEKARAAVSEQDKEATRLLRAANAKRAEENEFMDRIARDERELEATKSKSRKEELEKELTQSKQQLAYLHEEVDGAFNKAREAERETARLRGQASLTVYLEKNGGAAAGTELDEGQIASIGQRIAGNESRIADIEIDERYNADLTNDPAVAEARTYDWNIASGGGANGADRVATETMQRNSAEDATRAGTLAITPKNEVGQGEVVDVDIAEVGLTPGEAEEASAIGTQVSGGAADAIAEDQQRASNELNGSNGSEAASDGTVTGTDANSTSSRASDEQPAANGASDEQVANNGPTAKQSVTNGSTAEQTIDGTTGEDGDPTSNGMIATDDVAQNGTDELDPSGSQSGGDESPGAAPNDSVNDVAFAGTATGSNVRTEDELERGTEQRVPTTQAGTDERLSSEEAISDEAELDRFLEENRKAELEQSLVAERDPVKRAALEMELASIADGTPGRTDAGIGDPSDGQPLTEEEGSVFGVEMDRTPMIFFESTKDEDIVTMLYKNYEQDKGRLNATEDPSDRAQGLSGLELMLADSLRGEMVRQATILELAPEQGAQVLPKMERLRHMRQEHIQTSERILAEQSAIADQNSIVIPTDRELRAEQVQYPLGEDPVEDRFISMESDRERIYASKVQHRAEGVDDALAFKMADLERMDELTILIDSIEDGINALPRKEFDKRRRSADKLIDERMIIRTDLGQRSAYLMKQEWEQAMDSVKVLDKQITTMGLAPDESLVLMSKAMSDEARTGFTAAAKIRKQADRTDDILMRDSLFRTAYAMELQALQELDKGVTVKTYLVRYGGARGETMTYEAIARRVLGLDSTDEMVAERAVSGTTATEERVPTTAPESTVTGQVQPSTVASAQSVNADGSNDANNVEDTAEETVANTTLEPADGGVPATGEAKRNELLGPITTVPAGKPVKRYEEMLAAENVVLLPSAMEPGMDPALLAIKSTSAAQDAAELEQRSLELADEAAALEDSATTARKRDQDDLKRMAVRKQQSSDSLHAASLIMAEEARTFELERRDAEQAKVLRDRLVKYYYLTPEEQKLVVQDPDESRYFQMKARALEQYDAATEAANAARINRELAATLEESSALVDADIAAGRLDATEGASRKGILEARSTMLTSRADSLSNIAARLRGAAGINESQATVLLQALPAERSNEWMALEMRTRRTESLLAETRDQAGRPTGATVDQDDTTPLEGTTGVEGTLAAEGTAEARTERQSNTRVIAPPFGTDNASAPAPARRAVAEVAPMGNVLAVAFPEELVTDIFELKPSGDRTAMVIPMDVKLPQGVVFKVQIGAFRKPIPQEAFSDMTPVTGESVNNGLVRYTAGLFTGFDQASNAKDLVRDRGYRDAFVVAYRDGKRIPLGEAMRAVSAESLAENNAPVQNTIDRPIAVDPAVQPATTERPAAVTSDATEQVAQVVPSRVEPAPTVIQAPVVLPTVPPSAATNDALANYPSSAAEIVNGFVESPDAASYYNVPGAAPARQVEAIKGLFFTVQVGVYSKPVPLGRIFNIAPLNTERTSKGQIRYTTGVFSDTEQARSRKDETVGLGVKDAFVTAYLNGKRIPMQEAAALLEKFGGSILAKP